MQQRSVTTFHYTLRDNTGTVLDSSIGGQPITYLEGGGQIIEGLEEQLHALPAGSKRLITVPAAKAYGLRDESQQQRVPRKNLPVDKVEIGDMFQAGQDRHAPVVTVVAIEGDDVVLDANHPLAGRDLVFDVEIVSVRPAQPDEISHGHVHGPGGHHH